MLFLLLRWTLFSNLHGYISVIRLWDFFNKIESQGRATCTFFCVQKVLFSFELFIYLIIYFFGQAFSKVLDLQILHICKVPSLFMHEYTLSPRHFILYYKRQCHILSLYLISSPICLPSQNLILLEN